MNNFCIFYIIVGILHGIWGMIRQMQRWSGNSVLRLISVFLINSIGWIICLPWSIVVGSFIRNKDEKQTPIEEYGK